MNVSEFVGALGRLDLTQMDAGRLFHVDGRTVRRWIAGKTEIPHSVAIALRLMLKHGETAATLESENS